MARIQQIKHPDGDVIYPISHTNAIIDDSGNRLENVLQDLKLNSSIWRITEDNGVENTRTNGSINLGTGISVYQHTLESDHKIIISNSDGINISDGSPEYISIGTNVRIGSAVRIEGAINMGANLCIGTGDPYKDHSTENVFIGNRVYIDSGFDSRNISSGSGGTGDNLWAFELGTGVIVNRPDEYIDIVLGTDIRIGTDGPVDIGSNVYIESGFDSRKGRDSLWQEIGTSGSIESVSENRYIILGSRVNIGANSSIVTIDGESYGFEVSKPTTNRIISIGTNVEIGGSGETIKISSAAISITDFQESSPRIYIGEHFNTNDYFNIPTKEILPTAIPFESLSNGNIKLGELEFMPATPSGDPLHYAYETAGAEYNSTTDFIIKDAPWADMVDTIDDKAKWGFDIVDASQVKQMTIGNTTYNYVQTTRNSPEGTTEPRYFLVGQASDGTWVEDETKVLHLPGHWYLNGLGDITGREMNRIYNAPPINAGTNSLFSYSKIRTAIPGTVWGGEGTPFHLYYICANSSVVALNLSICDKPYLFTSKLEGNTDTPFRYFINIMWHDKSATTMNYSPSLKTLLLSNLTTNLNCYTSKYISKPSILHIINNSNPTTPITITLHAGRYAQLAEDADIVAALEAKNTALEGTGGSISLVSA